MRSAPASPRRIMSSRPEVGRSEMTCEDPDHPDNWPRNMFVWRSNMLGSSGKGHEYFLKHLLGTTPWCAGQGPRRRTAQSPRR